MPDPFFTVATTRLEKAGPPLALPGHRPELQARQWPWSSGRKACQGIKEGPGPEHRKGRQSGKLQCWVSRELQIGCSPRRAPFITLFWGHDPTTPSHAGHFHAHFGRLPHPRAEEALARPSLDSGFRAEPAPAQRYQALTPTPLPGQAVRPGLGGWGFREPGAIFIRCVSRPGRKSRPRPIVWARRGRETRRVISNAQKARKRRAGAGGEVLARPGARGGGARGAGPGAGPGALPPRQAGGGGGGDRAGTAGTARRPRRQRRPGKPASRLRLRGAPGSGSCPAARGGRGERWAPGAAGGRAAESRAAAGTRGRGRRQQQREPGPVEGAGRGHPAPR